MIPSIKLKYAFADLNCINNIEWTNTSIYTQVNNIDPSDIKIVEVEYCTPDGCWSKLISDQIYCEENSMSMWHSILTFNSMISTKPSDVYLRARLVTKSGSIYEDGSVGRSVGDSRYLVKRASGPNILGDNKYFSNLDIIKGKDSYSVNATMAIKMDNVEKVTLNYNLGSWDKPFNIKIPYESTIPLSVDGEVVMDNKSMGVDYRTISFKIKLNDPIRYIEYYVQINDDCYDSNDSHNYKRLCEEDQIKDLFGSGDDNIDDTNLLNLSKTLGGLLKEETDLSFLGKGVTSMLNHFDRDSESLPLNNLLSEVQDLLKGITNMNE